MSSSRRHSVGLSTASAGGDGDRVDSRVMIDIPLPLEFPEPVLPPSCWYCGAPSGPFEHEHQLPLSCGGDHGSNIVRACVAGNALKVRSLWRSSGRDLLSVSGSQSIRSSSLARPRRSARSLKPSATSVPSPPIAVPCVLILR